MAFGSHRIFLDTSVVNLIVDHGEAIFDGYYDVSPTNNRINNNVYALYQLFLIGRRTPLEIIISPTTFKEVLNTSSPEKRAHLLNYSSEVWHYFTTLINENIELRERDILLSEEYLSTRDFVHLPDPNDRRLIVEALFYKCDTFCTTDWRTMLKHRDKLTSIPIKLITPFEWWQQLLN